MEAHLIRLVLRGERIFRPRIDTLSYAEEYITERYRFSKDSIIYLEKVLRPESANVINRGRALHSLQILCRALPY